MGVYLEGGEEPVAPDVDSVTPAHVTRTLDTVMMTAFLVTMAISVTKHVLKDATTVQSQMAPVYIVLNDHFMVMPVRKHVQVCV